MMLLSLFVVKSPLRLNLLAVVEGWVILAYGSATTWFPGYLCLTRESIEAASLDWWRLTRRKGFEPGRLLVGQELFEGFDEDWYQLVVDASRIDQLFWRRICPTAWRTIHWHGIVRSRQGRVDLESYVRRIDPWRQGHHGAFSCLETNLCRKKHGVRSRLRLLSSESTTFVGTNGQYHLD